MRKVNQEYIIENVTPVYLILQYISLFLNLPVFHKILIIPQTNFLDPKMTNKVKCLKLTTLLLQIFANFSALLCSSASRVRCYNPADLAMMIYVFQFINPDRCTIWKARAT